jgi:RNA polymerase sigma factor (sigma-70 family)
VSSYNLHDVVLRAAGVPSRVAAASDGELLNWFVAERDSAAFAELVRRHGGMVLGVARRELGDTPDADDVCQATFLVLARKAAAVRRKDAIGAWLYGVARRVARKIGAAKARRRGREAPLTEIPGPDTTAVVSWRDGLRVLDEELGRLPDSYRAPLVLCYLEGRTQDEAARQLGWSLGAFRGRLERGRARLRDRLTRRGVGLAVLAAAAVARPGPVSAAVQSTIINTAAAVAAGETFTVPVAVAALADGAIRTMTVTKLQWVVGVVAVSGLVTVGGLWATGQGPAVGGQPPAGTPAQPAVVGQAKSDALVERRAGASQRQKSMNNLKQIILAVINYEDGFGYLPADIRDKDGKPLLSWRVAILPFIEQDAVYRQFKLSEPWDSEHNLKLLDQIPKMYRAGFEAKDATYTYYQAFAGPDTPMHPPAGQRIRTGRIRNGASNTFGLVEAGPPVPWTKPVDIPFDAKKPVKLVGPFSNVWFAAALDGSVYDLRRDIEQDALRNHIVMSNRAKTPPLDTLRPLPVADTAEERAQSQRLTERNRQLIDQIHRLMKEHVDLLGRINGGTTNLGAAEDLADRLQGIAEELAERNKMLRDTLKEKPSAPAPEKKPER